MTIERAICLNKEYLAAFLAYGLPDKELAKAGDTSVASIASDGGR